jgi:hypothetical protein
MEIKMSRDKSRITHDIGSTITVTMASTTTTVKRVAFF